MAGSDVAAAAGIINPSNSSLQLQSNPLSSGDPQKFRYPPHYSFKPFYTLQPNLTTRASQLTEWSALLLAYATHHRIFRLTTSHPIFENQRLGKKLSPDDVKVLFEYMSERERAEWVDTKQKNESGKEEVWIWWKTAEEWAGIIANWVEETGQRNTVLTLYELCESDQAKGQEFHGMPMELLRKALGVLIRRGKASVFGDEDQPAVKIY